MNSISFIPVDGNEYFEELSIQRAAEDRAMRIARRRERQRRKDNIVLAIIVVIAIILITVFTTAQVILTRQRVKPTDTGYEVNLYGQSFTYDSNGIIDASNFEE